jgi:hypothetical protein
VADVGYSSAYVASLNQDGAAAWGDSFGSAGEQFIRRVQIGVDGEVVVAGGGAGLIELDKTHTSTGGLDVFVARFSSSGSPLFSGIYGSASEEFASGLAVSQNGNMVLVGGFGSQLDFGGGSLTTAGGQDVFIAKLNRDGQHLWSHRHGLEGDQSATDVVINQGRVVVVGDFAGIVDFGKSLGTQLDSNGSTDIFVAVFDP